MNLRLRISIGCVMLFSAAAVANRGNVEVVVPVSPEIWGKTAASAPPCGRCCIYQSQNYSEGAVVKVEGVLLQCARDPNVVGTNPLVWVRLKN